MDLVTGAGGFIGGYLVRDLLRRRRSVRAVDIKPSSAWRQTSSDAENLVLDLRLKSACEIACRGIKRIYHLAADMGGIGFIEQNRARCSLNVLIDAHLLSVARDAGVELFFYSSSACVYPTSKQDEPDAPALREEDAYPALAEDGYGWQKLYTEQMCRHFQEDFGLSTRVARF